MLNDPTFVEAARVFALRMIDEGGPTDATRMRYGFRLCTGRMPDAAEMAILQKLLSQHRKSFAGQAHAASVKQLLSIGLTPPPQQSDSPELAAWTSIGRTLLNLNETITRN